MKNHLLVGIVACGLATGSAFAASPGYNWSGTYIGVGAGGAWGMVGLDNSSANDARLSGPLVEFQGGHNWQTGNYVFGISGDFNFSNIRGSVDWGGELYSGKIDYFGAVEARGGLLIDPNLLLYGTIGGAFANLSAKVDDGVLKFDDKRMMSGWTVGVGLEYALTQNTTTFLQYKHFDMGSSTFRLDEDVPIHLMFDVVKAGVNFKLR